MTRHDRAITDYPTTSFSAFAEVVLAKLAPTFRHPKTLQNWQRTIRVHTVSFRDIDLARITVADVGRVLETLSDRPEVCRVTRIRLEQIFREARRAGLRGENPATREALLPPDPVQWGSPEWEELNRMEKLIAALEALENPPKPRARGPRKRVLRPRLEGIV